MAYGARLESVLGATPREFESRILRHREPPLPQGRLLSSPPGSVCPVGRPRDYSSRAVRRVQAAARADGADRSGLSALISVHALHFAEDPVAALAEWRRVTTGGGRLSLSVPGPRRALSYGLYDPVYRRHGLQRRVMVPARGKLTAWARAGGWRQVNVVADPTTIIRLAEEWTAYQGSSRPSR